MSKTLREVLVAYDTYIDDKSMQNQIKFTHAFIAKADRDYGFGATIRDGNYLDWQIDSHCGHTIYGMWMQAMLLSAAWDSHEHVQEPLSQSLHAAASIIAYG